MNRGKESSGFTLVELLFTVVIAAILTAVAIPAYQDMVIKSRRSEAKSALMRAAAAQEKYFLANGRYATAIGDLANYGIGHDTENGWYALSISWIDRPSGREYLLTAEADSSGPQAVDSDCQEIVLVLNTGEKKAIPGPAEKCWP